MLPTPSTSHVNYDQVYEPAEDSYLLLDTLSSGSEVGFLHTRFRIDTPSPLVVEIGPGSGVVLAFVTAHAYDLFGRRDLVTLGVDVNPVACAATRQTVQLATKESPETSAVFLDSVLGDLTLSTSAHSIDVLIFNPPYVPSEGVPSIPDNEKTLDAFSYSNQLLALSTDGGVDGMETTERLLAQLGNALSGRGVAYVLLCAQNKPDEVIARVEAFTSMTGKWCAERVGSSGNKAGWERLCVIRIWRESVVSNAFDGKA